MRERSCSTLKFVASWKQPGSVILAVVMTCSGASHAAGQATTKKLPTAAQIRQLLDAHFDALPDRKPYDLVTQEDVAPLLNALKRLGLDVADLEEGVSMYVSNRHQLAVFLRSPQGKVLMRQIGHVPNAYDRLERLSQFSEGRKFLDELFRDPSVVKRIEWLCSAEGAAEVERRWPTEERCANFDVSSGRLYTRADVLDHFLTMQLLAERGLRRPGE